MPDDDGVSAGVDIGEATVVRYQTPTGQPCPRSLRVDGTVWGSGDCQACGYCLLLEAAGWPVSASRYGGVSANPNGQTRLRTPSHVD